MHIAGNRGGPLLVAAIVVVWGSVGSRGGADDRQVNALGGTTMTEQDKGDGAVTPSQEKAGHGADDEEANALGGPKMTEENKGKAGVAASQAEAGHGADDAKANALGGPKMTEGNKGAGAQDEGGYEWICATREAAFAARDGAGALVFKGKMWLLGGWNPRDKEHFPHICNSEVWSSTDGVTWTLEMLQAPWEGRHTAGYAVHDGKMWIVGGDCNQGHYQTDVWNSVDGVNWELVNEKVPWAPRVLHYTVVFDGKIWIMGGQTLPQFAPADEVFYTDVWNSADGVTWTRVTEKVPWAQRGMVGGGAVFEGRMWILGGGTYDTPKVPTRLFYNDVWSSVDGVNWERHVECAPWEPRQYHDVAVFDGKLWVMEGCNRDSGNRNDVWYSSDGVNWYELPDTPWAPRHAASVFVYDDALWMVAGNNMTPDAWRLVRKQ